MIEEKQKYDGIYQNPAKYPRYGHTNHGARAVAIVSKWAPKSLLDLGCGWNEFSKQVKTALPETTVVGADFSCPGADVQCEASCTPFEDKSFDVVTSFDMMEHLVECEVDAVLEEMARVSNRFIFSISYQDSVNKWQGKTLHPTVKPEEWWMLRIARAGGLGLTKQGRFITGRWSTALRLNPDSSVVLVGNGPSVQDAPNGKLIDAFEEVIRFNNFKIEGFEKNVGTKTTLWSTFFKAVDTLDKHPRAICICENTQQPSTIEELYRIPSWCYNRTRQQVNDRKYWDLGFAKKPDILASSGLQVATFLLEVVGVKKVHLYGFDHFSKKRSGQHHYWMPMSFKTPAEHDGQVEAQMFEQLRLAGKVAYL